MSRFWSQTAKSIKPYVPGEQPKDRKYIKLNTNENPYPPSPKVLDAIRRAADETLRLYPDPSADALRDAVASSFGIERENVFIGNGSDELLAFCFPAFFEPAGLPILFADVTYSFYPVYAQLFHIPCRLIPLDEEFRLPVEGYLQENGGILIANPNAPTGMGVPLETIERILRHNENSVVVLDEAYVDFGGESSVGLISRFPNLLVIRTLSKSCSLAGLRVGFALGGKELIEGIIRIKDSINSYTIDRLAQAGAREAIGDAAYFEETKSKIVRTRGRVAQALVNFGFRVLPSQANFLFIGHPQQPARVLFQKLREQGILVRFFDKPRIDRFLRVSIGTDGEMDLFLEVVARICEKPAE
ncbi:MAG TPA: histidinol-phosphate transaminase [Smithellaceae bacterium]|jgi:histidinol-phosphate aminotransferase|nr:histidinol-phosphate transaminase [Smithellaceae bacterium]HOQ72052.1 histidinol-phosphate transaminase [Smithellaceae bacterium]HPL09589.1 histidinol-phosphate transaminase [Smithellaceae bacterium]